ncbi:MAG: FadR family transcriptional regulator [Solirubrobacterales bacterium]|nr:FadR family transcriptional regulator [Solirubrobacterales bacterium]
MPTNSTVGRGEKVASLVARQIVRNIVDADLTVGSPMEPEAVMLDRFGVSRASLREALRILETHGLITIKPGPGGGPSVADVDSGDFARMATLFFQVLHVRFREVVEARLIIEPVMAGLAATRHDPELEDRLMEIVGRGDEADADGEWIAASHEFHTMVLSMSGNSLLNLIGKALKDIYTDRVAGLTFPAADRQHVRKVHREIAQAIASGDAQVAETLMREHMIEYASSVEERHPGLMDEIVDWR